jgi:hypothetical protein
MVPVPMHRNNKMHSGMPQAVPLVFKEEAAWFEAAAALMANVHFRRMIPKA